MESLTGLRLTGFLTLDHTRVTTKESLSLQSRTKFGIDLNQRFGNCHTESFSLAGNATAIEVGLDVILTIQLSHHERLFYLILQSRHAEILFVIAIVNNDLTGARLHIQTGNCGFSSA